jgi:2-polyprenyl-3-methyl-5-hydroxy-6-metoxy-1,4-benzoquinol methylase
MNQEARSLKALADILLSEASTWLEKRESLLDMHALFVRWGALNLLDDDDTGEHAHLWLESGRAIAPKWAGLCLFEIARTRQFVRGLMAAVEDMMQQNPGRTVQVLDAGCGPYALLPLLAGLYFTPRQVQFYLLDIQEENLQSARTLIASLGMEYFFGSIEKADATKYEWPGLQPLDIVITETMSNALQKEPQVAIMLHLAPQLQPQGVLLPASIEVDLRMVSTRERRRQMEELALEKVQHADFETPLGSIICIHRNSTADAVLKNPLSVHTIPLHYDPVVHHLELCTWIQVYKDICLQRKDCSLTIPYRLIGYHDEPPKPGEQIAFRYALEENPGLEFWAL